jgi:AAA ATPase domain
VLVTGPAGVGKTALLAEAASLAADAGIGVFCGGGDRAARAVPLGAILDALVSTDDPPVDPARLRELGQSADQRFWLVRELQESLEKAARWAPLLVVVDDLQWADAASASTLATLSRRLANTGSAGCWRCAAGSWRALRWTRSAGGGGRVRDPAMPPG